MRSLHIITSVNPAHGGPIEGLTQLERVLKAQGHVTEIASLDDPASPWVAQCPMPIHALGPGKSSYGYSNQLVPWLRAHHRDYDMVCVRGIWQFGSLAAWRALRNTSTPYFVFPHGMLDPWFKEAYPLKHLKKTAYWIGGEYRVLRDARGVCFTCEEERVLARQSFRPYRAREIVVNYGTAKPQGDPEKQRQTFLAQFPELKDKRVLLFLSRIHHKKGCDLLIEAFAKIASQDDSLHLVIAGPDQVDWKAELERQAEELGVANRITWPGMLRDDMKWGAFHLSEVFVLPSHQENFGIVVAEALACGLPVLISNKVNIWREIEKANAGLVQPDTLEGTLNLLQDWLGATAEKRREMSHNALQCFEQNFEIHRAAESLLGLVAGSEKGKPQCIPKWE
jgi:glycosyltransferase involved in cell wall biosynthesis